MKVGLMAAALAALAAGAAESAAQDGTIAGKIRRWQAEIQGDLKVDDDGGSGSNIDVDSTLGLDEKEDFDEIHLSLGLPIIGKFNFQYMKGEYEGDNTLTSDINFAGTTFTATSQVHTEMSFDVYTLLWQFGATTPGVIGASAGAGAIAGVKYFDVHAQVSDNFGNSESVNINAPIPVFGFYFRTNIASFISFEAQVHGMKLFNDILNLGVEGTIYDATVAVDLKFSGVFVGVGYRYYNFDFEYDNGVEADVELWMEGFFFEAGLSF